MDFGKVGGEGAGVIEVDSPLIDKLQGGDLPVNMGLWVSEGRRRTHVMSFVCENISVTVTQLDGKGVVKHALVSSSTWPFSGSSKTRSPA